jgi:putative transferase (TIGR04331 family)
MPGNGRFLVTTECEETWDFNHPVLFLGEWCCTYDRKLSWDRIDSIIAEPYGIDEITKLRDFNTLVSTQEKILPDLVKVLNSHHATNYSVRFWQILIGHWLEIYTSLLINRINTISKVIDNHTISGATFIDLNYENFIPVNLLDLHNLITQGHWNSTLDLKIIKSLKIDIFPIKIIKKNYSKLKFSIKKPIFRMNFFRNKIQIILNNFVRKDEPFIISTYLPELQEILLQLSFKVVPKNWNIRSNFQFSSKSDPILREKLKHQLLHRRQDIYVELLFELFPICFLEGFHELRDRVDKQNWPSHPKFIFTSNNYATDEEFKLYTAIKTEQGIKYFIGQHGNNYGTSATQSNIEERISDHFISWGTGNLTTNKKVGVNFKIAGVKVKHNPNGKILLLLNHLPRRESTWDVYAEHALYFKEQISLIDALENDLIKMLSIRLHSAHVQMNFFEKEKLLLNYKKLIFDDQKKPFHKLLNESRLVVFSYDSTGILETLALNIPTLAFWQKGLSNLNYTARKNYESLVKAGVFHLTPQSIAEKINEVALDVDFWWNQESIQNARKQFCELYSRTSKKPIRDIQKILNGTI